MLTNFKYIFLDSTTNYMFLLMLLHHFINLNILTEPYTKKGNEIKEMFHFFLFVLKRF